jgi:hypothetical protein
MDIYQPYTYLIGWSKINKWYYGAEYGYKTKIANPNNLWTTYFTSSETVAAYREIHGEPDIIQVRRTFKTAPAALIWEQNVLRKLDALHSIKWLNKNNGGTKIGPTKGNTAPRTLKQKEAASNNLRLTMSKRKYGVFLNRKHSSESIEKMKKPRVKIKCSHCHVVGGSNLMKRWHFDKCKLYITQRG